MVGSDLFEVNPVVGQPRHQGVVPGVAVVLPVGWGGVEGGVDSRVVAPGTC